MMSVIKKLLLSVVLFFSSISFLYAQIDMSKYQIGLSAGVLVYQGDLTPNPVGSYKTLKPQLSLHLYRIISTTLSARIDISRGKLYGNDSLYKTPAWRTQRNFNFTTPVTEISTQLVWSFLEQNLPKFSPYIFGGIGFSFVNIKKDYSKINTAFFSEDANFATALAADNAKKLPTVIPVIPVGVGVKYFLNDKFSLTAETNYRFTFTDYLDGFSQSANPNKNDHYLSHTVGLVYSFGNKDKGMACPKIKH